jgi:uncharacterized protein involved in exopolysaccharide biosynthesis
MMTKKNVVLLALWLGLACAAIVAVAVYFVIGEQYTATARLLVSMQEHRVLNNSVPLMDRDRFEIFKCTQQELLLSRGVLTAALRKPDVAAIPIVRYKSTYGDAVDWLAGHLSVSCPQNAEVMLVSLRLPDTKEAQGLVKSVVDSYKKVVVDAEEEKKRQRLSGLETICNDKDTEMRNKREQLKGLGASAGGWESPDVLTTRQKLLLDELALDRQELAKSGSEQQHYRVDLAVQKAFLEDAKADARAPILKEIKRLEITLKVMAEQNEELKKKIQILSADAKKFGQTNVDIQMIQTELKTLEQVAASFTAEREKLRVEITSAPRISILEPAEEPVAPSNLTSRLVLTAIAALAAFCCAAAAVLLWHALTHRITTANE